MHERPALAGERWGGVLRLRVLRRRHFGSGRLETKAVSGLYQPLAKVQPATGIGNHIFYPQMMRSDRVDFRRSR